MQPESKVGSGKRATMVFLVTILVVVAAFAVYSVLPAHKAQTGGPTATATAQGLSSFQSYSQLQAFVAANAKSAQAYDRYGGARFIGGPMMFAGGVNGGFAPGIAGIAQGADLAAAGSQSGPSFTTTNVQVQGVDEPDMVKTDGIHLFVATNGTSSSSSSGSVTIMDAYPPNSTTVLSTVSIPGAQILGIEVAQGRLMVIDQRYTNDTTYIGLLLYNTGTLSSPKLMQNETVAGNYVAARLAQGYLYAILQQPSYQFNLQGNATGVMPFVSANGQKTALPPSSVYYTPNNSQIGDYTMVISVGMASGAESTLSVLTGPSSTVFVSTSNIFVVYSNYRLYANADNIPGDVFSGGVITSPSAGQEQNSTIFRASYSNGTVAVQA
ncbi:MAG TPA: beta-propeller domain-containing protein, partial [Nitrososphaerales archaeon]|nr:beta-propeller domain-containing protein [Nitrososphaerales archaeon]